jgi:hypothetical protein
MLSVLESKNPRRGYSTGISGGGERSGGAHHDGAVISRRRKQPQQAARTSPGRGMLLFCKGNPPSPILRLPLRAACARIDRGKPRTVVDGVALRGPIIRVKSKRRPSHERNWVSNRRGEVTLNPLPVSRLNKYMAYITRMNIGVRINTGSDKLTAGG